MNPDANRADAQQETAETQPQYQEVGTGQPNPQYQGQDQPSAKYPYYPPTLTTPQAKTTEARVNPDPPKVGDVGPTPVPPSPEEAVPDTSSPKPSSSLLDRLDSELQGVISHFSADYAPETERALRKAAGDVINSLRHDAIGWLETHAFPQEPTAQTTLPPSELS